MMLIGAAIATVWFLVVRGPHPIAVGAAALATGIHPALGAAVGGCALFGRRIKRISQLRRAAADYRTDQIVAVDLVAHGVAAGVSFDQAASTAASFVSPDVGAQIERYLRMWRTGWTAGRDRSPVESMFFLAQKSASSGAPLADQLLDLSGHHYAVRDTEHRERLERLPVKMLFPLAFLILPGFLLVAVVPAVAGGLMKLTL